MAFSVSYLYEIIDRYSPVAERIKRKTVATQRQIARSTEISNRALKKQRDLMGMVSEILATGAAVLAAAAPVKAAIAFESAMADVLKVVTIGKDKIGGFIAQMKSLAIQTGLLPKEIAKISAAGGRLGYAGERLAQFTELAIKASIAFDLSAEQAGNSIASFGNKLGLSIGQMEGFLDTVNYMADNTAAKSNEMIEIIERTAGTMKLMKAPKGFVTSMAAIGSQLEVTAELGASGINMMLRRMQQIPKLSKKLQVDPKKTIFELVEKFEKVAPSRRMAKITKMFGAEAARFVAKLIASKKVLEDTFDLSESEKAIGSMGREFKRTMATTERQILRAKAAINVFGISIGNFMLPAINSFADSLIIVAKLIDGATKHYPLLTKMILFFTSVIIGAKLATLAFGAIMAGWAIAVGLATGATGAFSGAMALLNAVMTANPIGATLALIGLLITAGYAVYRNWDKVVQIFKDAWEWLTKLGEEILSFTGLDYILGVTIGYEARDEKGFADKLKKGLPTIATPYSQYGNVAADSQLASNSAIQMTSNQNLNANGQITVSATQGTKIENASLETNTQGNLGLNIAGAQ